MFPWGPPKATLFAAAFICSLLGTIKGPVQTQVNGMLDGSVLLSAANIPPSENMTKIEWDFQLPTGTNIKIAEFQDGKMLRPDPRDRFGTRLELADETTLRIQNLTPGDSGTYKARVTLHPAKIQEYWFHLRVYAPVPAPEVLLQEASNSSSGCNVSLECWVPEKAGLNVSWRTRDALRPLESGSDRYQLSSDGWRLQVYLWPSRLGSTFSCLVTNPVDQKRASFDLLSVCPPNDIGPSQQSRNWWLLVALAVVALAALLAAGGTWIWKKRRKEPSSDADFAMAAEGDGELQYSEIAKKTRRAPEGDEGQELGGLPEESPGERAVTVYAFIQPPAPPSDPAI